jgi:hypothetical protein
MKTISSLSLAVLLVAGEVHAADEGAKKAAPEKKASSNKAAAKKNAGSDKNVAQKAESNVGDFLHRNKIWVRQEKKKAK